MGLFEEFTNKPKFNPAKPHVDLPRKGASSSPTPPPSTSKQNPTKYDRLFGGRSEERVKGPGGLEEDLKIILKKPSELARLNAMLRSSGLPQVYAADIPKVVKQMIEYQFSPEILRDNRLTKEEINSPYEAHRRFVRDQKLKSEKGTREWKRAQKIHEFFKDLLPK